jgi:chromosome segregation ATPase
MAGRSYKRDRNGRFASTGGASYGNRSDRDSDQRWARSETKRLTKEQDGLKAKKAKLEAKKPEAKVAKAKAGLDAARAKKAEAGKAKAASQSRLAELKKQLEESKARLGGHSATKRGSRR